MKASFAFGLGVVSGAAVVSTLLSFLFSRARPAREAEIATLRSDLASAQSAAQRDRDAVRARVQEIQALREAPQPKPSPAPAIAADAPAIPSGSTVATYLGAPVPPPANLDRRYSPEELAAVFRDLSETLGIQVEKLATDTTEFPFVIHGRVASTAGGSFFKKIESELRALPGYTYDGSVTGSTRDGSTYFALNMTPSSVYPPEQADAIRRRMMLRLQIAASSESSP